MRAIDLAEKLRECCTATEPNAAALQIAESLEHFKPDAIMALPGVNWGGLWSWIQTNGGTEAELIGQLIQLLFFSTPGPVPAPVTPPVVTTG